MLSKEFLPTSRSWSALYGMRLGHCLTHAIHSALISLPQFKKLTQQQNDFILPEILPTSTLLFSDALLQLYLDKKEINYRSIREIFLQTHIEPIGDIGSQTNAVISAISTGTPSEIAAMQFWEQTMRQAAGSGGVQRALPVAMLHFEDSRKMEANTRLICEFTHYDQRCRDAAIFINRLISAILKDRWHSHKDTMTLLLGLDTNVSQAIQIAPFLPTSTLNPNGYVITTIQAAYHILTSTQNFQDAILLMLDVNNDCHSLGAITGALIGALWHDSNIPHFWETFIPNTLLSLSSLQTILHLEI